MKKLWSAALSILALLGLAAPAFADAALPPYHYSYSRGFVMARNWVIAILIGVVIVAAAIIIMAIKYRREQNARDAAEAAARAAGAKKPEDP